MGALTHPISSVVSINGYPEPISEIPNRRILQQSRLGVPMSTSGMPVMSHCFVESETLLEVETLAKTEPSVCGRTTDYSGTSCQFKFQLAMDACDRDRRSSRPQLPRTGSTCSGCLPTSSHKAEFRLEGQLRRRKHLTGCLPS